MAKRANPYNEDFIPQSKVHVGIKQYNNSEDRIKKVYEKTLELLFSGARKSSTGNSVLENTTITCNRSDCLKQLFIGKNGALQYSGEIVTKNVESAQCSCGSAVESKCAYCESLLCSGCQHHCTLCDHFYCSRCSLFRSEGSEVCVSCYD